MSFFVRPLALLPALLVLAACGSSTLSTPSTPDLVFVSTRAGAAARAWFRRCRRPGVVAEREARRVRLSPARFLDPRNLGHGRERAEFTAGHAARRRQRPPIVVTRWPAPRLPQQRSRRPLRDLFDRRRRNRPPSRDALGDRHDPARVVAGR